MKNIYCFGRAIAVVVLLILMLTLSACDKFEYSPYEVRLKPEERKINEQHIDRIEALQLAPSDTLRFALTSDTQGFYAANDDMVNHLNQRNDISFVLHGGDITDYGLLKEFRWIHRSLSQLKVPYVAVIGNHDAVGNGQQVYQAMFSDYDFSFTVAGHKFIFLNTNYLEFDREAPKLDWLEAQLQDRAQYEQVFVISHIPPNSPEFGEHNMARYEDIMKQYDVSLSIHGHTHSFDYYKLLEEGVYHMNVGPSNGRNYVVMQVYGSEIQFERISF